MSYQTGSKHFEVNGVGYVVLNNQVYFSGVDDKRRTKQDPIDMNRASQLLRNAAIQAGWKPEK